MDVPVSDRRWASLKPPLSTSSLEAIKELNFEFMTPVQGSTIPYFMNNKDVAVEAVTGSGKTLAFVVPLLEILAKTSPTWSGRVTGGLVLTPTRELAAQIASVLNRFLQHFHLNLLLLIGGTDVNADVERINSEGGHIVIATPGRMVDLLGRQDCNLAGSLHKLEVLVLDEADRLLELGFESSINTILSYCPKQRRTGLFSATLNHNVNALVRAGLRNPVTITVRDKRTAKDKAPTPSSLSNYYIVCDPVSKMTRLLNILSEMHTKKVIVFFATCASVGYFSTVTKRVLPDVNVIAIHGKIHKKRQQLFTKFSESSKAVLMCTDVMARGVDFPSVDWVIQFDPPSSTKAFVHRCGRTARMGRIGQALVMLLPSEVAYVDFMKVNQHINLQHYTGLSEDLEDYTDRVRSLAIKEREIYEQGKKAFVSFVHFYFKHECKLIFHHKELDLVGLAKGYAMPHLPKMPEFRGLDTSSFDQHPSLPAEIKFKDKTREKQRQLKIQEGITKTSVRQQRKHTSPDGFKRKASHRAVHNKSKRTKVMSDSDLEELATEARLLKKFKAGKISKKELDEQLDDF